MVELADLLTELKNRSGYSYDRIGHKTHISRSTVHRYCRGSIVPAAFAPLERIATSCGASREEMARLYRLWERAQAPRPSPVVVAPVVVPAPRRRWVLLVLLGLIPLLHSSTGQSWRAEAAIAAPMWTNKPFAVPAEFAGVTKNAATAHMPHFGIGSLRLWDSGTRWQKLEPERGRFEWFRLDRLVDPANQAGVPVLLTLGGTPSWASPDGPLTSYDDNSRTSPPDDLDDWDLFIRELTTRYAGRVQAYELWDTANSHQGYTGTTETLVAMTERASKIIKEVDPQATVVCPGMAELWDAGSRERMEHFARLGGYDHCDAAAVKLHPRTASDRPETMLEMAAEVEKIFYRAGARKPQLWNTGQGHAAPLDAPLDPELAADHAARFYLASLYAEYRRVYFYNWGSDRIPVVLQPKDGVPTQAARHVEQLRGWLLGARNTSCGYGAKVGLPDNLWQCRFVRDGKDFVIWWTDHGTARMVVPPGTGSVESLSGSSRSVERGESIGVTGSPVLVR